MSHSKLTKDDIRTMAENDLAVFARLVNPHRVYGAVHDELFQWWTREDAKDNQLCLLPRDHQKSHCIAVRVAWEITRNPAVTILYVSATSTLAEKQLYAIKNILSSPTYQRYWHDMINPEEGKREQWSSVAISVDHPKRKEEGVRDSTVIAAGLTTNITGQHCNIAVLDDVVVPGNAYTKDGREKVAAVYSQLASIETTDAKEWIVGTRYHPDDLYKTLRDIEEEIFDDKGEIIDAEPVYEVFERVVENSPSADGSGEYLWARQQRPDGKYFGFDARALARKRAKYVDRTQFFAQYYNNPNDAENAPIRPEWFQYYDKKHLSQNNGIWYFKERRLNVVASMDFAFSTRKRADYTVITVIGVDYENNVYVLDISRFKTNKISEMFDKLLMMHNRWDFRKLRAEVNVAQITIVNEFKQYMKQYGVFFSIDEYRPTRADGKKEERMDAVLRPRYEVLGVYHYKGGNCQLLEDELVQSHPEHDDIKDALTAAIDVAKAPMNNSTMRRRSSNVIAANSRFGGMG